MYGSGTGLALCFALAFVTRGATLEGRVISEKGRPVDGLVVSISRSITDGLVANPIVYRARTDKDGGFSIEIGVPGNYVICGTALEEELLDSCRWPNATSLVRIDANQRKVQKTVTLQAGTTLRIRVDDPSQLMAASQRPPENVNLTVGVWSSAGRYYPASLVSQEPRALNFEILVPKNADLRIAVEGYGLKVLDDMNNALNPRNPNSNIHSRSNESDQVRRFKVVPQ